MVNTIDDISPISFSDVEDFWIADYNDPHSQYNHLKYFLSLWMNTDTPDVGMGILIHENSHDHSSCS